MDKLIKNKLKVNGKLKLNNFSSVCPWAHNKHKI